MLLQCVTVCDRYDDFLAETLPLNLRGLRPERMVVVTSPEDLATQRVCEFHDVDVVLTDSLQSRWGEFHKARAINAGLERLDLGTGWVLHLDADVAVPARTRTLLDHAQLDPAMIYGTDRMRVPSAAAWRAHQALPPLQHDGYHVRFAFELGARFNAWHIGGWAPVGYFQLWHPAYSGVVSYPAEHTEADKTDVLFAQQWPRARRALIPEVSVYHLESEPADQGTNWGGRRTARFGATPSSPHPTRHEHKPHRHHHHRPDPDPYGCHHHHGHDDD